MPKPITRSPLPAGADYIAVVRLSDKANTTLANPGEPCDQVPAASLPWLEAQGLITRAPKHEVTS